MLIEWNNRLFQQNPDGWFAGTCDIIPKVVGDPKAVIAYSAKKDEIRVVSRSLEALSEIGIDAKPYRVHPNSLRARYGPLKGRGVRFGLDFGINWKGKNWLPRHRARLHPNIPKGHWDDSLVAYDPRASGVHWISSSIHYEECDWFETPTTIGSVKEAEEYRLTLAEGSRVILAQSYFPMQCFHDDPLTAAMGVLGDAGGDRVPRQKWPHYTSRMGIATVPSCERCRQSYVETGHERPLRMVDGQMTCKGCSTIGECIGCYGRHPLYPSGYCDKCEPIIRSFEECPPPPETELPPMMTPDDINRYIAVKFATRLR